ncbi:MAG: DUF4118 domain-containing protein [Novosphingobium sp.]|uniref:DUF4118 domain-containing protein n=1 Tax=Novosphingobium sp. TaxID=1874826 RepID=UPI0032BE6292
MKMNPFLLDKQSPDLARSTKEYAGSFLAVSAATLAGLLIAQRWGDDPVVLLYILPVLGAAIYGGLWPAMFTAVTSTLAYNFFFTAPYRTFLIHSPADVTTVVVLFLVALVTSQLASQLRDQARLAAAHAARNGTIAGFARKLLSCASEQDISQTAVDELADLFGCNAVLVAETNGPHMAASAPSQAALAPSDLAAAALTLATGQPAGRGIQGVNLVDWHFRPVASNRAVLAAVGLARDDGSVPITESQTLLLENLLDQTALAIERARLESDVRDVVLLRERDAIRSGLLASIGEDVKPRLTAIGAAARELKRSGQGSKSVITGIATEVIKLDRYIDNLLNIGPVEERLPISIRNLTIDLHLRIVRKAGVEVHLTPKEYGVLSELAKHQGRVLPHRQLLMAVWGPAHSDQIDYLRVAIRSLRQKLEQHPEAPVLIVNEPAVGYRLDPGRA